MARFCGNLGDFGHTTLFVSNFNVKKHYKTHKHKGILRGFLVF
jgi:hypothetical protein